MALSLKEAKIVSDDLRAMADKIDAGKLRVVKFAKEQILKKEGKKYRATGLVTSVGFAYGKGK